MGFKRSTDLDSFKKGRKKMAFSRSTDLILYENKGIQGEKSRVLSKVQIWIFMKKEKKWGWAGSADLKSYENKGIEEE